MADHTGGQPVRQQPRRQRPSKQQPGRLQPGRLQPNRQRPGALQQGRRWARLLPATVTATALLAVACGGSGPTASTGSGSYQTAFRKELAYAECMRAHGVPGFPDPNGNGIFDTTIANRDDFHGPAFTSANDKCVHLQGSPPTAAQTKRAVTEALRYAACIRAHGVPNFQVRVSGGHVGMGFQRGSAAANTTRSLIAQRICRPLLPRFLAGT